MPVYTLISGDAVLDATASTALPVCLSQFTIHQHTPSLCLSHSLYINSDFQAQSSIPFPTTTHYHNFTTIPQTPKPHHTTTTNHLQPHYHYHHHHHHNDHTSPNLVIHLLLLQTLLLRRQHRAQRSAESVPAVPAPVQVRKVRRPATHGHVAGVPR